MARKGKTSQQSNSEHIQLAWQGALILALVGAFVFLRAYLGVIVLALLLAYLFYPMKIWFIQKTKKPGLAVGLTTVVSILIVAIPVMLVLAIAIAQTLQFVGDLSANSIVASGGTIEFESELVSFLGQVNSFIESTIGSADAISVDSVLQFVEQTLPKLIEGVAKGIVGIIGGVPGFITLSIIYLFVFVEALAKGPQLVEVAKNLSPFSKEVNKMYLNKIGSMAKAMVKGQFLIALVQGVESAAVVALVGFSEYFWFMAVLFTFMSFIPLGAGIITIPLGILMILFGNPVGGIVVLFNHFVFVTNIDNYIRPKVVPDDAQLSPALTMVSAFAGVGYFGFLGVIYGPIIMIIITTTISAYIEQKHKLQPVST